MRSHTGASIPSPTKQQVVVELLHQQPLAANREKGLHQQDPKRMLGRDLRTARVRIDPVEQPAHVAKDHIDEPAHATQREVLPNMLFEADVAEHRRLGTFLAAHGSRGELVAGNQPVVCLRIQAPQGVRGFS